MVYLAIILREGPMQKLLPNARILLVDDDLDVAETLAELLTLQGALVKTANSADEAMKLVDAEAPFDFILSDVRMPGGDGISFLARARESCPKLPPFYFLTGFASTYAVEELLAKGARGVLEKPFDLNKLIELIRSTIETHA